MGTKGESARVYSNIIASKDDLPSHMRPLRSLYALRLVDPESIP